MTAHFEYDRCPISWRHRIWGSEEYTPEINIGVTFLGEKGTIWVNDNRWVLIPSKKGAERVVNDVKTDTGVVHVGEFLDAVRWKRKSKLHDCRRSSFDDSREACNDRPQGRRPTCLGWRQGADCRQPGGIGIPQTRLPCALEASLLRLNRRHPAEKSRPVRAAREPDFADDQFVMS
jgi:hypothetical protein